MRIEDYKEEILSKLGGDVVDVELEEVGGIEKQIKAALRETGRYINLVRYATMPYHKVIDLSEVKVSAVTNVMRTQEQNTTTGNLDPMYLAATSYRGGYKDMSDYRSYMRMRQIRNTLQTDLQFVWDANTKKLYINTVFPNPTMITIAYVPLFDDVSQISDPYWIDIIMRLALALTKEALGRVRGKYKLNNALYDIDSDQLLQEAQSELVSIREYLQQNANLVLPID